MKLTKNFSSNEYIVSKDHPELAKKIYLCPKFEDRIKLHAQSIMQPMRDIWNGGDEQFIILSGLRSRVLNKAVGGSYTSDHIHGIAADFTTKNLIEKYLYIIHKNLPYREVILYPDQDFIHVSINIPFLDYQHEALVKYKGSKKYLPYRGI